MADLFVVIGAGASADCADERSVRDPDLRPPLVTELFDHRFSSILDRYPLVRRAAPEIRQWAQTPGDFERYLRAEFRDSRDPDHQRVFHSIPLYLQHLLWEVSKGYAIQPDHYDLLVRRLLRQFDKVVFITLNYDTLLDESLNDLKPMTVIDDFITMTNDRRWALIKLHGSVTWRRRLITRTGFSYSSPPAHVEVGDEIQHKWANDLDRLRTWSGQLEQVEQTEGYPALSTPLGPEDELNCPPRHIQFLRDALASAEDGINLLTIGYSAYDKQVLKLLEGLERPIRHLMVVDRSEEKAREVCDRLLAVKDAQDHRPYPQRFSRFCTHGGLDEFFAIVE